MATRPFSTSTALLETDFAEDDPEFIRDTSRSTLERLPAPERDRYLAFAWQHGDFPGGPRGPNEARALAMFAALSRLRPERRVNIGPHAVVRESEFDAATQAFIRRSLIAVPGEARKQLHPDAADAFVRMREAAARDGVTLSIHNSYRRPEHASANAAASGNPNAVARYSAHMLGLAVDLNMSQGSLRVLETRTRPFQNVVDMYKSPVHKWMFLRGEPFGWFPFAFEPWHWEYNPPGFRARFRQPRSAASVPSPAAAAAAGTAPPAQSPVENLIEDIADAIPPPRPPLAIAGSVGRGGRNQANDVRAVQERLVELRALDAADAATEQPAGPGVVPESGLTRTIAAIEGFQRHQGIAADAKVDLRDTTRLDLDRAIPAPTAAEYAAVAAERNGISQVVSRGLTIAGPVGATTAGNAPDDVRAVQRRLVELGRLRASHGEAPAPGATGQVPSASLRATIAALRAFQATVPFWVGRRTVTGAITPGVVAPGDATARLLDRISVYTMRLGSDTISFRDHVRSGVTHSDAGVDFSGTALPAALPQTDFERHGGLTALEAAALRLVATFEGKFDGLNTYDRARVSIGFIQFAGGRGLPPYLGLLKARQPAKFRTLLQKFGIDVEYTVPHGVVEASRVVVLDPGASRVLRAEAAETAIRDDKRLTTALILSGRDREVQHVQIEAAVRNYARPIKSAVVSWAAGASAPLEQLLRSGRGRAALFDRAIQEGVGTARRRFERVLRRLAQPPAAPAAPGAPAPKVPSLAAMQSREGDVLAEIERDLQAAADVLAKIKTAQEAVGRLLTAARVTDATVAAVLARADLATARTAIAAAHAGLPAVLNVSTPSGATVDATLTAMNATLVAEERRLAFTPAPASPADLATALTASRDGLAQAGGPVSSAPMFLGRTQRIRRSTLDASLSAP